jgi:hypothetical protein
MHFLKPFLLSPAMDIIDPILGIAEKLYSLCGEVKANKKRCQRLGMRVKALEELVRAVKMKGLGECPAHVENGLSELKFTLESAQDVVKKYASANYLKRILKAYDQGDDFESLNERLNDAAQVLSLALQVDQRQTLQQVFQEATRWREDEEDREIDCLELQKCETPEYTVCGVGQFQAGDIVPIRDAQYIGEHIVIGRLKKKRQKKLEMPTSVLADV